MKLKNKFIGLLGCALLLVGAVGCSVGTGDNSSDSTPTTGSSDSTPPEIVCTHETSEWEVYEEPTCSAYGTEVLACTDCDEPLDIRYILEKTEHTYADEYTCHDRKCENCDYVYEARIEHTRSTDPALETKAPVCVDAGYEKYVCTTCGDDAYETIDAYNLFAAGVLEWRAGGHTSALLDIENGVASFELNSTKVTYAQAYKTVYLKPTDWLILHIESGKFTIKLTGSGISEKTMVNQATASYSKIPMSDWITQEGEYRITVFLNGPYGATGVINELSLLSSKTEEYHSFDAENICEHCGHEKYDDSLLENYGNLYSEDYADRWSGTSHFTTDETGAVYTLSGATTWVDTYVNVGLKPSDYLQFKVESGKFRFIIKQIGRKEINIGYFTAGTHQLALSDYIDEADNYQLWVVPTTTKGVAAEDRIELALNDEKQLPTNYGYLYGTEYTWVGASNFSTTDGKTAVYAMDGSKTYVDSYINVTIKPTDYILFDIEVENCTGISFMLKQSNGSGEFYKKTYGTGTYEFSASALGVTETNIYRLQISPLTKSGVSGTVKVKNLQISESVPVLENYGYLYGTEYTWAGASNFSTTDGKTAVYTMDGTKTYVDSYLTVGLKPTDVITFTIEVENCTGVSFMLKQSDGSGEFYKKTYSAGTYTLTASELGVTKEGNYRLQISPLTKSNVSGTVTVKDLCISEAKSE